MASFTERFPAAFFARIPQKPGVYLMRNERGRLLYIGKAKSLRARLRSYRNAEAEFLDQVARIDWEVHASEARARLRENELIHALTPPFNVADCWEEDYLYICLRELKDGYWRFRLTGREDRLEKRDETFGCFRHRRTVKDGYTAVLRLLYAAFSRKSRFSFPAKITRSAPPYEYVFPFQLPRAFAPSFKEFFSGRSLALLPLLVEHLLENETLPPFARPGIREDLETAHRFFENCAQTTRELGTDPVSQEKMRRHVRGSLIAR